MRSFGGIAPLAALFLSPVIAHPYPRDNWGAVTTTWTVTYTSTISSYYAPAYTAPAGENCVPPAGSGQIACGPICCATWQWCSDPIKGQCLANVGQNSWTEVVTTGVITTTQFSAPYRPTSGSSMPTASLGSATTVPTDSPQQTVPADTSTTSGELSSGAIAGIVVGTIAGVALLILCCFCCIVRGLWGVVAGILGLGKKKDKKERVEIIEERYSRHGSQHGGRPVHKSWFGFGGGGGRPSDVASRKEKKSGGGLGWLAAGAGAAALLLGLRKRDDKRRGSSHKSRSDWSSSYYTDSYTGTSPSESNFAQKLESLGHFY
ncbi:uncharacterized protein B0I36DRAFT_119547 [Microdochium trichocladiopsis]|uniref:Mid2 domain-containing protein n=1 Tax=Microdochium trichocladiopsis TaxID=1682393 RepID=A0A9P9BQR5_9PEZI|nr:uncharacterized protein B0I36DRAFT_119547 [Microdochium trichocladiopsis]KAH7031187.1 hypothetical protein B0I36DRAFT_119547 [Microdochium trichocladiopsis]